MAVSLFAEFVKLAQNKADLRHSIIRRSGGVTIAFLIGHAFNYALFGGANRLLDTGRFGVFYTAVMAINVVMAPMMALTILQARHFAELGAIYGRREVAASTWRVLGFGVRVFPLVAITAAILAAAAHWLGVEAWESVLLIPLAVWALALAELERAALQGMLLFRVASALWIASTATQFVLGLGALLLFTKVWAGLAGITIGAGLVTFTFTHWIDPRGRGLPSRSRSGFVQLKNEIRMIISYSLFILLNNGDILCGYVLLSKIQLDVYAASALLPKAIVTATFAVVQVLVPVAAERRVSGLSIRTSVLKAVLFASGIGAAGAALLCLVIPIVQRSPLAIRGLDFELSVVLALSAVALSALRVLVVVEGVLRRYVMGGIQAAALLIFILLCFSIHATALRIAEMYLLVSGVLLVVAAGLVALPTAHLSLRLFLRR